jgi:hypothetical protein
MVHTLEILDQGMPFEAYTLTLDGDPDLNLSTEMFSSNIKREIADLTMNSDIVARGIFAAPGHPDYPFTTRHSMEDTSPPGERQSLLQCNFTLDQPWDYEKIIEEKKVGRHSLYPYRLADLGLGWIDISTPLMHILDIKLEFVDRKKLMDSTVDSTQNMEIRESSGSRYSVLIIVQSYVAKNAKALALG